jgi:hypothetical protein
MAIPRAGGPVLAAAAREAPKPKDEEGSGRPATEIHFRQVGTAHADLHFSADKNLEVLMAEDIRIYVDPTQIRRVKSNRQRMSVRSHSLMAISLAAVALLSLLLL